MSGVLRTWHCQNSRCQTTFDAWEPNPECPTCHGVRVSWVPAGGHIKGAATKTGDAELRALADIFRMGDMNSAEAGRAAKKVRLPDAPAANSGPVHTFAPGFSASVNPAVGAQCVPTANKVEYKVKTSGDRLAPNASYPGIRSNTAVEAAHRG